MSSKGERMDKPKAQDESVFKGIAQFQRLQEGPEPQMMSLAPFEPWHRPPERDAYPTMQQGTGSRKSRDESHNQESQGRCVFELSVSSAGSGPGFSSFLMGKPRQRSYLNLTKNWAILS